MTFSNPVIKKNSARVAIFFLTILVFINPFAHITTIKEICFYGALLAAVVSVVSGERSFLGAGTPLRIPMVLFVGWAVVGLFFALDKENSRHDIYAHLFRYVLLYVLLVNLFQTRERLVRLSWVALGSLVGFSLFGLYRYYVVDHHSIATRFLGNSEGMTTNLVNMSMIFALFLSGCNFVTLKKWYWKAIFLLFMAPLFAVVMLTQTRSAIIALSVSGLLFLFFYKGKLIPVVAGALLLAVLVAPVKHRFNNKSMLNDIRLPHDLLVLEVAKEYPITGIGFGMETFGRVLDLQFYKKRIEKKYKIVYPRSEVLVDPHDMYTDILVRTGVPGFILFMIFFSALFKMLWQVIRAGDDFLKIWGLGIASSLVAYFIIGFFEPVFNHMHEFNLTLMISIGSVLWKQSFFVSTRKGKSVGVLL